MERSRDGGKGLARDTRVRWALEEVASLLVRARAAFSATSSASISAETVASVGTGDGKAALPVIAVTMLRAYVMRAGTEMGR